MPAQLALILCTIFVFYLLTLERKQHHDVTRVLWVPTVWLLLQASKPLGVWFQSPSANIDTGSPLDRRFLLGLLFIGVLILVKRKYSLSSASKEHKWLVLLIVYMLISVLWSDIPFTSFKRWIREFIPVVMAFILLTEPSPREAVESICRRSIYILVPFSILLIKYYPEYGKAYGRWFGGEMWIGVTMQKNGLGRLCLISIFFLVWSLVRRLQGREFHRVKYQAQAEIIVLVLAIWLLKGPTLQAYSATAASSLFAGLAVYFWLLRLKKRQIQIVSPPFTAMLAFGIAFGIITVVVGGSTVEALTSTLGRDTSLTGRTDVWAALLPVALKQPLLGHGFGGFWTSTTREMYDISEGHSGYLDVLLDLGFVGIVLLSMFILSICRKAQKELNGNFDWACLAICFLVMAVLHNITESSFNSLTSHMSAIVVFLSVTFTGTYSNNQQKT